MLDPKKCLVDAIGLSERYCRYPIQGRLAYATQENFLGRVVDGYTEDALELCLLTRSTAEALCAVQNYLNNKQLSLFIFDGFRPLRAVRDFAKWLEQPPVSDYELLRKKIHYPHLEKKDLVRLGYLPKDVSRHCFGNVVDLSIVNVGENSHLDMGACFDFFDEASHITATASDIGEVAYCNRQLLLSAMQQFGFIPYQFEYWHFDYSRREVAEPMDISVSSALRGINIDGMA